MKTIFLITLFLLTFSLIVSAQVYERPPFTFEILTNDSVSFHATGVVLDDKWFSFSPEMGGVKITFYENNTIGFLSLAEQKISYRIYDKTHSYRLANNGVVFLDSIVVSEEEKNFSIRKGDVVRVTNIRSDKNFFQKPVFVFYNSLSDNYVFVHRVHLLVFVVILCISFFVVKKFFTSKKVKS